MTFCWSSAIRRKGVLWFHHCLYVSMSVGKRVFSKTAHSIFLKLLIKLGCLKGNKLTELDFWEKILDFAKKKNSPLMCRFFGFKWCTIMTSMILLKPPLLNVQRTYVPTCLTCPTCSRALRALRSQSSYVPTCPNIFYRPEN